MKKAYKEVTNKGLKREYEVTVTAKDVSGEIDKRLQEVAKTAKVDGFRPGKVPLDIMRKKHGVRVTGEVLESVIKTTSHEILTENDIVPALQPKIEITQYDEGSDLQYKMELETLPDAPEIAIDQIKLERSKPEIGEKELEISLKRLAEAHKRFTPITGKRAAKKGDAVNIDFLGKIDGEPFEGGASSDHQLELGSGQFIPGFEEQLIGKKAGEECVVKTSFPENYHKAELAGKDVEFDVKIKQVLETQLAEINDEFAQNMGFDTVDKLKEEVMKQVEKDYDGLSRSKLKKELFDLLDKQYQFEVPESMVNSEFDNLWKQSEQDRQSESADKKSEEAQKKEYQTMANRRVRLGILLAETGRKKDITISQDELRQAIFNQARQFAGHEQEVVEYYRNNPEASDQLKGPILEDKVVDFILENAKVTDKPISVEALLKYHGLEMDKDGQLQNIDKKTA